MSSVRSTPWAIPRSGPSWPSGRLEVLDDHDAFDEHERGLVEAAAAGYPSVGGFTFAELDRGNDPTAGRVEAGWFGAYGEAVRYTDSVYTEAWDGDPDAPPMLEPGAGDRSGPGRRGAELRRLRRPLPVRPRHRLLQHR